MFERSAISLPLCFLSKMLDYCTMYKLVSCIIKASRNIVSKFVIKMRSKFPSLTAQIVTDYFKYARNLWYQNTVSVVRLQNHNVWVTLKFIQNFVLFKISSCWSMRQNVHVWINNAWKVRNNFASLFPVFKMLDKEQSLFLPAKSVERKKKSTLRENHGF